MARTLLIAGGGIAGMAAALAAARSGWHANVYEKAAVFGEAGAGIQLGPNATRVLHGWGLRDALEAVASEPAALVVRDAKGDAERARMPLGAAFCARYGAPYLTAHRADLHALLRDAALAQGAKLRSGRGVALAEQAEAGVWLQLDDGALVNGDALAGADGLWSTVRGPLLSAEPPRPAGHLAYRTLIPRASTAAACDANEVSIWLGPRLHVVAYPVRRGEALNVVAIVGGEPSGDATAWGARGEARSLAAALGQVAGSLRDLLAAAPEWRVWSLHDRPPVAGPQAMAQRRIALVGDAAHPMLPYLAQGAAMAIEDAQALADALSTAGASPGGVESALASYAQARWRRCAQVQRRAQRNARIFHASGLVRLGRDLALRLAGARLLDVPWLFGAPE